VSCDLKREIGVMLQTLETLDRALDALIAQRAALIAERDGLSRHLETAIAQRDAHARLVESLKAERDAAIRERDRFSGDRSPSRWIPCSERMPAPGVEVWITDGEQVRRDQAWWFTIDGAGNIRFKLPSTPVTDHVLRWRIYGNVTHWRPIEEPPPPTIDQEARR
jgi:hypothetical protein